MNLLAFSIPLTPLAQISAVAAIKRKNQTSTSGLDLNASKLAGALKVVR